VLPSSMGQGRAPWWYKDAVFGAESGLGNGTSCDSLLGLGDSAAPRWVLSIGACWLNFSIPMFTGSQPPRLIGTRITGVYILAKVLVGE
jgi:hypothetical protein